MTNCTVESCSQPSIGQALQEEILKRYNDKTALQYLPIIIYVIITQLVGTIGNSLALYIYRYRFKKTSSHYFIQAMATFDLIACCLGMPTEIYDLRYPYTFTSDIGCKIFRFTETFTVIGSAMLLVEIAIDRYWKICKPLMAVSLKKIKFMCVMAAFASLLFCMPTILLYGIKVKAIKIENVNITIRDCSITNSYDHTAFQTSYFVTLISVFIVIFILIAILYTKLWLAIRRRRRSTSIGSNMARQASNEENAKKCTLSVSEEDSNNVFPPPEGNSQSLKSMRTRLASIAVKKFKVSRSTIILFVVTVTFVVSYLPSLIVMVCRSAVKSLDDVDDVTLQEVMMKLFSKFYFLNNAANPIIYSFLNPSFRIECIKVFHWLSCGRCDGCCVCCKNNGVEATEEERQRMESS